WRGSCATPRCTPASAAPSSAGPETDPVPPSPPHPVRTSRSSVRVIGSNDNESRSNRVPQQPPDIQFHSLGTEVGIDSCDAPSLTLGLPDRWTTAGAETVSTSIRQLKT